MGYKSTLVDAPAFKAKFGITGVLKAVNGLRLQFEPSLVTKGSV